MNFPYTWWDITHIKIFCCSFCLSIINNAKNYLIGQQNILGYWDDNSDATIYLGYYNGVAGIAGQLLKVPDLEGPTLSAQIINITQLSDIQYFNTLKIDVSSSDIGSGLDSLIIAYRYDSGAWNEKEFTNVGGSVFSTTIQSQDYNTVVDYYIVSIDGTGLLSVDDNSGLLYSYTVKDNIEPSIEQLNMYNSDDDEIDSIQYATGGYIIIKIDEPDAASGISSVMISYDNTDEDTVSVTTEAMVAVQGQTNTYKTIIPGLKYHFGDNFEYNFTITDNAGNTHQPEKTVTSIGDFQSPNLNREASTFFVKTIIAAYTKHEVSISAYDDNTANGPYCAGIDQVFINYTVDSGNTWLQVYLVYDELEDKYPNIFCWPIK